MLRVRSIDVLGEWTGGGESARDDSGMSWYGAKLAAIIVCFLRKTYAVCDELVAQFLGVAKFGARGRADAEAGVTGAVTFGRDPSSRRAGVLPLARE